MDALDNRIAFAPGAFSGAGLQALHTRPQVLELLNDAVQRLVVEALARAGGGVNLAAPGRAVHQDAGAPGDAVARAAPSPREWEVLRCIAAGDSNEMIARALNLGPHTVKCHVANILDKLGARSRTQAAAWLRSQH